MPGRPRGKKQMVIDLRLDTIIKIHKEIDRRKFGGEKQVTKSQVIDDLINKALPD